jgi:predicted glycoside hydrolase/deacetylase ChbG (UPF0249 family)
MTMFNPALKQLGFSEQDRVVIIHADDVAVSQASIAAYLELMDFGTITCGSAMTPCSWFPEIARIVRENPHLDMGLHLPVPSETAAFRGRRVTTPGPDWGVVELAVFSPPRRAHPARGAAPAVIIREVEAQIRLSLKLGLTPTHLDSHHGILYNKELVRPFVVVARQYHILPVLMRMATMGLPAASPSDPAAPNPYGGVDLQAIRDAVESVEETAQALTTAGTPVPDYIAGMPIVVEGDRLDFAKKLFSDLQPGLTHFAFHPTKDTPETRAITPTWPGRVGDYETFMKQELKDHLKNEGIQLIGYKALAALMPARQS